MRNANVRNDLKLTRSICIGTAMHEFHVIQVPNTCDGCDKIALFAFSIHSYSGRLTNLSKIESGLNCTTAGHAFVKAMLRLGLRAPLVAGN